MKCPHCRRFLEPRDHRTAGVEYDVCPSCKGIWLDAGEMQRVLDVAAHNLKPPPRDERRPTASCPRCSRRMALFLYPQTMVRIDMCRRCHGIWLDANELTEIRTVRRALRRQGRLAPSAPAPGFIARARRFVGGVLARLTGA